MTVRSLEEYRGSSAPTGKAALVGYATGASVRIRYKRRIRSLNDDGTQAYATRAVFTWKLDKNGPDSGAAMQRVITLTPAAWGRIVDSGLVSKTAELYWYLSGVDTAVLGTDPYYFSAVMVLSNGEHVELESGLFLLEEGITDSPAGAERVGQVTVTPNPLVIAVGLTAIVAAAVEDVNDAVIERLGHWWTSNPEIMTVDEDGTVHAHAIGTVSIGFVVYDISGFTTATAVIDDIGIVVANLGGNANIPCFWDFRYNARLYSGALLACDDARCETDTGRFITGYSAQGGGPAITGYAGLDGVAKATIGAWVQYYMHDASRQTIFSQSLGLQLYMDDPVNKKVCWVHNGTAVAHLPTPPWVEGDVVKLFWVFDGTQVGNANRLKLYYSLFDWVSQTWGVTTQAVLTFDSAVPATLASSGGGVIGLGHTGTTAGLTGALDEVRLWSGVALNAAQIGAETLTANPVPANLRYSFNGNANNTGTDVGYNGTMTGVYAWCSDDLRYAPPLLAPTVRPAYDAASGTFALNDVDIYMLAKGMGVHGIVSSYGMSYVGTLPTQDGGAVTDQLLWLGTASSVYAFEQRFEDPAIITQFLYNTISAARVGAWPAGRRVTHGWHTKTGVGAGSSVVGLQLGAEAAILGVAGNVSAERALQLRISGRLDGGGQFADGVPAAVIATAGAMTGPRRTAINDWAVAYRGATV